MPPSPSPRPGSGTLNGGTASARPRADILDPLARRLHAALAGFRRVPADLGEIYELVYDFIRGGGKLPVRARWIEGQGAPA
jgi:hypothetical protein